MITPLKYQEEIKKISQCYLKEKDNIEIEGLTQLEALVKSRIFNFSTGSDDKSFFGQYRSDSYKKKREKANLKTKIKDLQFTKQFRDDLQIGTSGKVNVLGFSEDRSYNIALGQENGSRTKGGKFVEQIGFPIFAPSDEEAEIVIKLVKEKWFKILDECLSTLKIS